MEVVPIFEVLKDYSLLIFKADRISLVYYTNLLTNFRDAVRWKSKKTYTEEIFILQEESPIHTSQIARAATSIFY